MIALLNNEPLVFEPHYPPGWKVRRLPGAGPKYWSGREGQVLVQQIHSPQYLIEYYTCRFIRQVTLLCHRPAGLQSILSLRGRLEHRLDGEGVQLSQSQFILVDGAGGATNTVVPAGQECHVLHTHYSEELRRDFRAVFPHLGPPRQHLRYFFRSPGPRHLHVPVLDTVNAQFLEQPRPEVQRAYFELKVRETLLSLLAQEEEPMARLPDARQLAIAEAAYAFITRDLSRHYPIGDIARAVGTNEADLKRFFKQVYGLGLFELLQRLRFEKAGELLRYEARSIKQVAAAVGYRHTTTFITEFRKYFGYTPSEAQRRG